MVPELTESSRADTKDTIEAANVDSGRGIIAMAVGGKIATKGSSGVLDRSDGSEEHDGAREGRIVGDVRVYWIVA